MTNDEKLVVGSYTQLKEEFRYHWEEGRIAATKAAENLNDMVSLLKKENPDWKISRIANKIWIDNEDLEGFSKNTIYRNLNENNKALLDPIKQQNASADRNNVLVDSVPTWEQNVIEESSIPPLNEQEEIQREWDLPEPTTTEEQEKTPHPDFKDPWIDYVARTATKFKDLPKIDQLYKLCAELKQELETTKKTNGELEERIQQLSIQKTGTTTGEKKFNFEYDFELPNGEIVPFVVTVFPEKNTGFIRLNKSKAAKK